MNFSEQYLTNTIKSNKLDSNKLDSNKLDSNKLDSNKLDSNIDNDSGLENIDNPEFEDFGRVSIDDIYLPISTVETEYVKIINFPFSNEDNTTNTNNTNNTNKITYMSFREKEYPIISFCIQNQAETDDGLNTEKEQKLYQNQLSTTNTYQSYTYYFDTNLISNRLLNSDEITIYKLIILNHYLNKSEKLHLKMSISFDGIFDKLDSGYDSVNNKFYVDTNSDNKIYLETKIRQYFEKIDEYKIKAKKYNGLHIKYKKLQELVSKTNDTLNLEINELKKSLNQNISDKDELIKKNDSSNDENKKLSIHIEKINNLYTNLQSLSEQNNIKYIQYKTEYSEQKFTNLIEKNKLLESIITELQIKQKTNIYLIEKLKNKYDDIKIYYLFLRKIFIRLVFLIFISIFVYLKFLW
jgi:hypothetical protein